MPKRFCSSVFSRRRLPVSLISLKSHPPFAKDGERSCTRHPLNRIKLKPSKLKLFSIGDVRFKPKTSIVSEFGSDWRSLKEGNEDPIELEFENEFEMKDANVIHSVAAPQANIKGNCAITVTPSEVVQASRNVINSQSQSANNSKNTNHPTTPRIAKNKSRKT
ncbi:hypothetical protein OROHE_000814 [Orobanche hederae]